MITSIMYNTKFKKMQALLKSSVIRKRSAQICTKPNSAGAGVRSAHDKAADHKTGEVMDKSFGEAYAMRSDEEGFGGISSSNQSLRRKPKEQQSEEFDDTQGSEVKDREKSRHQTTTQDE